MGGRGAREGKGKEIRSGEGRGEGKEQEDTRGGGGVCMGPIL